MSEVDREECYQAALEVAKRAGKVNIYTPRPQDCEMRALHARRRIHVASYRVHVCSFVTLALQVAIAAFHRDDKAIQIKSSGCDLVTETDKKVEELIFSFLREKFPSHW